MKTSVDFLQSALAIFRQYKELAERGMAQLSDDQLAWKPDAEGNSIYLIVKHLSGNMKSRWTDFLITDGEKPTRNRDGEFEDDENITREDLMHLWNEGWEALFNALEPLSAADLGRIVTIRGEAHSVMEAVNRQIAHYSYHVGQIVFLAKHMRSTEWVSLSIPRNNSKQFNEKMGHRQ